VIAQQAYDFGLRSGIASSSILEKEMHACRANSVIPMLSVSAAVLGTPHNALVASYYTPGVISSRRLEPPVCLGRFRVYEIEKSFVQCWKVAEGYHLLIHKPRRTQLQAIRLRPISGKAASVEVGEAGLGDDMGGGASTKNRLPEVVGSPGLLEGELVKSLSEVRKPYKPFPLLTNRHVETIFAAFFRSLPNIKYRRECLRMADGGTVALDWPLLDIDNPVGATLILLPGLTGGSDDTYVRHLLRRACKHGWNVVVFNSRGCADSPVTTPQFYSASFTEDLRQVVKHVGTSFPTSRLYAAGWSLGANILVRYLGQEGEHCPLSGAVSLCNPFDLVAADIDFHKGFNNLYDKALARGLRKNIKKHAALFTNIGGEYNIPKATAAKSVRDFDDGLTRGMPVNSGH
jgi:pimeloyl-ACP methyl ester carboxylesterase